MDEYRNILNYTLDEFFPLIEHLRGLACLCEATGADQQRDSPALTGDGCIKALMSMSTVLNEIADKMSAIHHAADTLSKELGAAE